jgi:hypothetical protein
MLFSLVQHHKYSITEIENMMPFERDLFVDMLMQFLDNQKTAMEEK